MIINPQSIAKKYNLTALAMIGSRARGDYSPYSDFDLVGLSETSGFIRFSELGNIIELHIMQDVFEWALKPSWWYGLGKLQILIDDGTISALPELINQWWEDYCVPIEEIRRNRDWLEGTIRKLRGAGSPLASTFFLTTSTWEILAGSFLVCNMPVPASSDMLRLAPQILGEVRFRILLHGSEDERVQTALELCDEIVEAHNIELNRNRT
jgi:predicted nucleotidyltransferase